MTGSIRKLIKRRRAIFKKHGRNAAWKAMKKKTRRIIRERRKAYNQDKKDKIMRGEPTRFHQCVRALIDNDKKKDWTPLQLYDNASEAQTAENLAAYFNDISNQYTSLQEHQIPDSFEQEKPMLTPQDIIKEIKEGKRTKSRVKGDLFINVLVNCIDLLSVPICKIYNMITKRAEWPDQWKTEYVTVIPKTAVPESESQCRNISCTNFLSKVYERIVLRWCKNYVNPKNNQYGGQPGCSTYHFLADTIDQVTEHLEDSRAASVLTSIDYSKAFNRIEHLPLLLAFKKKGAPTYLIKVLSNFFLWEDA